MARRSFRRGAVVAATAVSMSFLAACDPVPAPPTFTVTTVADGLDAAPGDGVCEMTAGAGDCSMRAAFAEGAAAGDARVVVPSGTYELTVADPGDGDPDLDVTGTLWVNRGIDRAVSVRATTSRAVEVAPSGHLVSGRWHLAASGQNTVLRVAGSAWMERAQVYQDSFGASADEPAVEIESGARLVFLNSVAGGTLGSAGVVNLGEFLAGFSSLQGLSIPALETVDGATSTVTASRLTRLIGVRGTVIDDSSGVACAGTPPTSGGYNRVPNDSCSLDAPTDQQTAVGSWVDLVPVGAVGCDLTFVLDQDGRARPLDGNGDGVAACDAGAFEDGRIAVVWMNSTSATVGRCFRSSMGGGFLDEYGEVWTVTGLPDGLEVRDNRVVGIPTEAGTFELTIVLRAPQGGGQTTETLTVAPGDEPWDLECA